MQELSQEQNYEFAQTMVVTCLHGIHLRAAAELAKISNGFEAVIEMTHGRLTVDAKSPIGLMQLGAAKGEAVHVAAEGPDAEASIQAISNFFASSAKCDNP